MLLVAILFRLVVFAWLPYLHEMCPQQLWHLAPRIQSTVWMTAYSECILVLSSISPCMATKMNYAESQCKYLSFPIEFPAAEILIFNPCQLPPKETLIGKGWDRQLSLYGLLQFLSLDPDRTPIFHQVLSATLRRPWSTTRRSCECHEKGTRDPGIPGILGDGHPVPL